MTGNIIKKKISIPKSGRNNSIYEKLENVMFMMKKIKLTIFWKLTWRLKEVKTNYNKNLSKYKESYKN